MVLLDSTAPKPGPARRPTADPYNVLDRVSALSSAVAHFGVGRLIAQSSYGTLPPRSRDEARANASTARHLASFLEEFAGEHGDAAGVVPDQPQRQAADRPHRR